jgi:hypothetical protein
MGLHTVPTAPPAAPCDYYTLALLLAEGQAGDATQHWDAFLDNLARITDSFAVARAKADRTCPDEEYLAV